MRVAPGFVLDPRIAAASLPVAQLALSEIRLQDDARWPWLVLIPRLDGLRELEDLAPDDRGRLLAEAVAAGAAARAIGAATGFIVQKLNLGALGNVVPQLHLHVVGRHAEDGAWPGPVWGVGAPRPYRPSLADIAVDAARTALAR